MKKSVIVAFIIFLAVIGWFFTGQISIGDERTNSQTNTQNIEENNDNTDKKK